MTFFNRLFYRNTFFSLRIPFDLCHLSPFYFAFVWHMFSLILLREAGK